MSERESDYVLLKRGLFYRPNAMGYTGIKEHAGRYTKADAESHADAASGVTAMLFDEAPMIAPNCFDDIAVKYLLGCIENRDTLIRALQHTPEPVAWPSREAIARVILTEVSGNDPDELIHHPAQKSWEAPTRARWMQFEEAADAILALFPIEGGSTPKEPT